jgi:hypothetical protein
MAKAIIVRVPFTHPQTGVFHRRGDIIGHPDHVAAHTGSPHEHHGHRVELPEDHPEIVRHRAEPVFAVAAEGSPAPA